jgi:hypothetical protein
MSSPSIEAPNNDSVLFHVRTTRPPSRASVGRFTQSGKDVMKGPRRILANAALMVFAATTIAATPDDRDTTRSECSRTLGARPSEITLHLEDRAGLAGAARDEMMRTARMLWRAAGVDVRWSPDPFPGDNAVGGAHIRITITADVGPSSLPAPRPIASIRFVDEKPSTSIDVYLSEVRALLDLFVFDDRPLTHQPSLLQDELLGRVLGRAVAHELGHFVFSSAGHARSGLMRSTHRMDQLVGRLDQPFTIIEPPSAACGQHP